MRRIDGKCIRWTGRAAIAIVGIAVIVIAVVWHQRVLPQKSAIAELENYGASCLYDFEYDFETQEGRISNYIRPATPPLLLRFIFGDDWLAAPVYVQLKGNQFGDCDVARLCDLLTDLPTVQHLNLRGTLVSDESSLCADRLQQIRVLDVRDTAFTSNGVKSLETRLPECRVLY